MSTFLLQLDADPKAPIDFRKGRWGHALHASTFSPVKVKSPIQRLDDWINKRRRFSVLVHSCQQPRIGRRVIYETNSGPALAEIYDLEWQSGVDDMWKLFLFRSPRLVLQPEARRR